MQTLRVLLMLVASAAALAAAAKGAEDYYWLLLVKPPNKPPVIDPVVGVTFRWPSDSVRLDAAVSDYPGDTLVYEWTQLSGPAGAEAEFIDPAAEDVTAVFPRYGDYLLQLSVSDGEFTTIVEVAVAFDFLRNYTNPDQLKLPADRVYPMGQKMMITAWLAKSADDLQKLADAGFTMQGPIWDTGYDDEDLAYLNTAAAKGLRAAHRLYTGAYDASSLAQALKDPVKRTEIVNRMKREILRIVGNSVFNGVVDIWLSGVEELSTRGSDCELNTSGSPPCEAWDPVYNEIWYLEQFQAAVRQYDPKKRPLWMSDVIGTSTEQFIPTHRYLDMFGPQMYLERIDPDGDGYTSNIVVRALVSEAVDAKRELDANWPVLRPRPVTVSFGAFFEPIPSRDNQEFIERHTEHDLYLALNSGLQGFQIYSWYKYPSIDVESWTWYKNAYYKHVKLLTDSSLDYAYLWGEQRDDLILKVVGGPEFSFGQPSISSTNLQYGDNRFVVLTNSASEPVKASVGNIPERCARVLDIREDIYLPRTSSFTTTLPALGVKLYRFDKDGDC